MKSTWVIASICVATLFGHYFIASQNELSMLRIQNDLSNKAIKIEGEMVRDLMFSNQSLSQENDEKLNRGYVLGALDALKKPDHYNAIWHDGYDRGTEVAQMMKESIDSAKEEQKEMPPGKKYGANPNANGESK